MFKVILSISILAISPLTLQAQELTLNKALSEVLKDSPVVQFSHAQTKEAEWKKRQSYSEFLPHIYAKGTYLTNKKYQFINVNLGGSPGLFPQIVPNSNFNLVAELPLFNGFASTNRLSAARDHEAAAKNKLNWVSFQTQMQVTEAFYEALATVTLKSVAAQNLKVLEDHETQAKLFRKNGLSTHYDLLRVEVETSNAKTDLADREDDIIIAREKLAEIMGHDSEERKIIGTLPIPNEKKISSLDEVKENSRADLLALENEVKASSHSQSAASRFWVPEFSLFADYTLYNNITPGLDDWESYRNVRMVGLKMTWNLFDGMKSFSEAKQSIQRKVQVKSILKKSQLASKTDYSLWKRKYLSQCRIYKARKEDVEKSKESVRLAIEGKKVGSRTDTDLLDAEAVLYRSQAAVVKAQLEAVKALVQLQLAVGQPVEMIN